MSDHFILASLSPRCHKEDTFVPRTYTLQYIGISCTKNYTFIGEKISILLLQSHHKNLNYYSFDSTNKSIILDSFPTRHWVNTHVLTQCIFMPYWALALRQFTINAPKKHTWMQHFWQCNVMFWCTFTAYVFSRWKCILYLLLKFTVIIRFTAHYLKAVILN